MAEPKETQKNIQTVLFFVKLREKHLPEPGFEPEPLALRAGALPTPPPR